MLILVRLMFLLSGGITIYSTFLEFLSITSFGFTMLSAILFPINSAIASATLRTIFLKEFLERLALFYYQYPIINIPYLLDRFLANNKNPYSFTYSGSIE